MVRYSDINIIGNREFNSFRKRLPESMQFDVMPYQIDSDRKAKPFARIVLLETLKQFEKEDLFSSRCLRMSKKPFIEGWMEFNISHSGNLVLFAYGDQELGVDIELKNELKDKEIMESLHSIEQELIVSSENPLDTFYDRRVRKEASLKALGIGITSRDRNCVIEDGHHEQDQKWVLYPRVIDPNYASCICVKNSVEPLDISEFKSLKMEL